MKNKKKILYLILSIISVVVLIFICILLAIKLNYRYYIVEDERNINKNEIVDENRIEKMKNELGITGNTQLYEVQKDIFNEEVVAIKPNLKYKVAFAGMIKKESPNITELDNIIESAHPKNNGIWIEKESREKVLESLKKCTLSKYQISNEGYLKILDKTSQNETDKKIEKTIFGDKLYIFSISSLCYIVDDVTGKILDYNFENMDKYQIYEYFNYENKYIIFVTENKNNLLKENEIFNSITGLLAYI